MQPCQPDPDPVRALLFDAAEALATALGETDPARRAAHLADLARLTAAAQAANDGALTLRLSPAELPNRARVEFRQDE